MLILCTKNSNQTISKRLFDWSTRFSLLTFNLFIPNFSGNIHKCITMIAIYIISNVLVLFIRQIIFSWSQKKNYVFASVCNIWIKSETCKNSKTITRLFLYYIYDKIHPFEQNELQGSNLNFSTHRLPIIFTINLKTRSDVVSWYWWCFPWYINWW